MSISKKFSILFFVSFSLLITIGFWINSINNKMINNLVKEKYLKIANEILLNFDNKAKIDEILKNNNLEYKNADDDSKQMFFYKKHTFGFISIDKKMFKDDFSIHINFLGENLIIKTPNEQDVKTQYQLNLLMIGMVLLLLFTFIYTITFLKPLKKITEKIENFSKGKFDTRVEINSNDEIGTLAKTFNQMATKLENLIRTREELLRDIGHELRTPITKGRFAIEKIEDFSQKELLKRVFNDLETLTSTLIEIERLNSNELNYTNFKVDTLILGALNRLYIEDENLIILDIQDDFDLKGDFEYLVMALKNLIDNAFKYATKLPIKIEISNKSIKIYNYGEKLSKEFKYYLKPFTQEKQSRQIEGFGLGLSIVYKITKKHNFKLHYEYINKQNCFMLNFV